MGHPKCFISYSWDSEPHSAWVRWLAEQLVANGIEVFLDQWDVRPGYDLAHFMEKSVREADFVLLVCTPTFAKKANAGSGGVGYEKTIITGEMFSSISSSGKFVPLLRQGSKELSLPSYLKSRTFIDFRAPDSRPALEQLLRHLYNEPRFRRPPLGDKPIFQGGPALDRPQTRGTSSDPSSSSRPSSSAAGPLDDGTTRIFLAGAGFDQPADIAVVSCVILEQTEGLEARVKQLKADLLHDPYFGKFKNLATALTKAGFNYRADDIEVRSKFIDLLAQTPFEAYACYARKNRLGTQASEVELFRMLLENLLFGRIRANKSRKILISLGSDGVDKLGEARNVIQRCVKDINARSRQKIATLPHLQVGWVAEPGLEVSNYVAWICQARLERPDSIEARSFEKVRNKVRLLQDVISNTFHDTRRHPLN